MSSFAWVPVWVSIIFLVHPVQAEAVACISGVSNLMYTLLGLTCLWAYIHSRQTTQSSVSKVLYGLALGFYFIGLFVKEQTVVIVGLIILYEYCFPTSQKTQRHRSLWLVGGFGVATLLYFIWRKIFLGAMMGGLGDYRTEFFLRVSSIPKLLLLYWRILLYPHDLHYYRSFDLLEPAGFSLFLFVFVVAGICFIVRPLRKSRGPLLNFAIGWFFITIFPVINIVPLVHEYSLVAAFDHFLYLPLVGFFLFIFVVADVLLSKICKDSKKFVAGALMAFLVLVCLFLTARQNTYWGSEVKLFERVVRYEQTFGRARLLLGKAYYKEKKYSMAIKELRTALGIMNSYYQKVRPPRLKDFYSYYIKGAYIYLAYCYQEMQRYDVAIDHYLKGLEVDPKDGEAHNNLGTAYMRVDDIDNAMLHFQQAVILDSKNFRAMSNWAVCFIQKGKYQDAERLLRKALSVDYNFSAARQNLDRLLNEKNKESEGQAR